MSSYDRIYEVVKQIPAGRVATYGQVAKLAGLPRQARLVGYALNALHDDTIPWHRVINSRGRISERAASGAEVLQRKLLEDEGIVFAPDNTISLLKYRWHGGKIKRVSVD